MNFQPGAVNWVTCAVAQVSLPSRYAPDHGDGATASPTVENGRVGGIAATRGQFREAVLFPSRDPRVDPRVQAAGPAATPHATFSPGPTGRPRARPVAGEVFMG